MHSQQFGIYGNLIGIYWKILFDVESFGCRVETPRFSRGLVISGMWWCLFALVMLMGMVEDSTPEGSGREEDVLLVKGGGKLVLSE